MQTTNDYINNYLKIIYENTNETTKSDEVNCNITLYASYNAMSDDKLSGTVISNQTQSIETILPKICNSENLKINQSDLNEEIFKKLTPNELINEKNKQFFKLFDNEIDNNLPIPDNKYFYNLFLFKLSYNDNITMYYGIYNELKIQNSQKTVNKPIYFYIIPDKSNIDFNIDNVFKVDEKPNTYKLSLNKDDFSINKILSKVYFGNDSSKKYNNTQLKEFFNNNNSDILVKYIINYLEENQSDLIKSEISYSKKLEQKKDKFTSVKEFSKEIFNIDNQQKFKKFLLDNKDHVLDLLSKNKDKFESDTFNKIIDIYDDYEDLKNKQSQLENIEKDLPSNDNPKNINTIKYIKLDNNNMPSPAGSFSDIVNNYKNDLMTIITTGELPALTEKINNTQQISEANNIKLNKSIIFENNDDPSQFSSRSEQIADEKEQIKEEDETHAAQVEKEIDNIDAKNEKKYEEDKSKSLVLNIKLAASRIQKIIAEDGVIQKAIDKGIKHPDALPDEYKNGEKYQIYEKNAKDVMTNNESLKLKKSIYTSYEDIYIKRQNIKVILKQAIADNASKQTQYAVLILYLYFNDTYEVFSEYCSSVGSMAIAHTTNMDVDYLGSIEDANKNKGFMAIFKKLLNKILEMFGLLDDDDKFKEAIDQTEIKKALPVLNGIKLKPGRYPVFYTKDSNKIGEEFDKNVQK